MTQGLKDCLKKQVAKQAEEQEEIKYHLLYFLQSPLSLMPLKFIYSEKSANFLRNLQRRFVLCSNGQIYGGDFAKFRGLLRIYEL